MMRHPVLALTFALTTCLACAPEAPTEGREPAGVEADAVAPGTVAAAAESSCTTASVLGLTKQIVDEIDCIAPGTYAAIPARPNLVTEPHVLLFLQKSARDALVSALDAKPGTTMTLTSALRTPPQQYLLSRWGADQVCGVELAAAPGSSNHEGGRALDVAQFNSWRSALESRSFDWFGPGDDVHFDYLGPGGDTRSLGVLAFQRLWNRNHPGDPIVEDGDYGGQTEARLASSPAAGFPVGATCTAKPSTPIEVYWKRQASGSYELRALAPQSIARVEYRVDGFVIGGATRAEGDNFPDAYTFTNGGTGRKLEVIGFGSDDSPVGRGIGSIDVTSSAAFFIRQMGGALYEVGIEQAPSAVAAVELRVDGFPVTDSVSGQFRTPRLAVRYKYTKLGQRRFALSTFNADGTIRGTITRDFVLE